MNLQMESMTTTTIRRDLRKQLIAAACGVALAVAAVASIGAWSAWGETAGSGAGKSASLPSQARFISRARPAELTTYNLVASQEQADWWRSQMLSDPYVNPAGYVFVAVTSPEQELRVRKEIDDAANMDASGAHSIQLVDLRPGESGGGTGTAPGQ